MALSLCNNPYYVLGGIRETVLGGHHDQERKGEG
jgi:hypothetical protein